MQTYSRSMHVPQYADIQQQYAIIPIMYYYICTHILYHTYIIPTISRVSCPLRDVRDVCHSTQLAQSWYLLPHFLCVTTSIVARRARGGSAYDCCGVSRVRILLLRSSVLILLRGSNAYDCCVSCVCILLLYVCILLRILRVHTAAVCLHTAVYLASAYCCCMFAYCGTFGCYDIQI